MRLSEFQLIERFARLFAHRAPGGRAKTHSPGSRIRSPHRFAEGLAPHPGLVLGPGDDCAVLRPRAGRDLLLTVDAVVEGVHFDLRRASGEDVGHKALAVSLSDIAAMGGDPRGILVAVELPLAHTALVPALARGMAALARRAGAPLVGGNFSRAGRLAISVTVLGDCPRGRALTRAGARPTDLIFLSGRVGDAALALRRPGRRRDALAMAQLRPEPRLAAGKLARGNGATAAIDISDGLVQDLGHLCATSGVGARLDAARLPLGADFLREAPRTVADPLALALYGGEDYALLFTAPAAKARALGRAFARAGEPLALVGECSRRPGVSIAGPHGSRRAARRAGWDHFR